MNKKALLVVSFGTSHEETRDKTIGAIENALAKAYPGSEVRRAFTSGMIMKLLRERDGVFINNVAEAMEELLAEGFTEVLVQPTHIINGDEYEKMLAQLEPFRSLFRTVMVGAPLLTSSRDYENVCEAIMKQVPALDGKAKANDHGGFRPEGGKLPALVLMGHGTEHFADAAYSALDYRFKTLGYENVFVGTVEGYPDIETVMNKVKAFGAKEVVLMPFMIVAGDHALSDMAGAVEDSWNMRFAKAGFKTACILKGIGEFSEIRDIIVKHAQEGK